MGFVLATLRAGPRAMEPREGGTPNIPILPESSP